MRGATTHGPLLSPAGSEGSHSSQGTPHTFIHTGRRPRWQLSQPATHSKQINPGGAGSPHKNPEHSWRFPHLRIAAIIPGEGDAGLASCLCAACARSDGQGTAPRVPSPGLCPGPRHQQLPGGLAGSSSAPPSPPCPPPSRPTHLQHVQRQGWDLRAAGMRNWEQWERAWCLCWFLHPSAGQPAQSLRNVAGTAGSRLAGKGIRPKRVFKMKMPGKKTNFFKIPSVEDHHQHCGQTN